MDLYYRALEVALKAHSEQKRKGTGVPYIVHPIRVSSNFTDSSKKIIALLHDVVEDSEISLNDLTQDFPNEVIEVLEVFTKKGEENYSDYIDRVIKNRTATEIKVFDMIDNLSDSPSPKMVEKYSKHLPILIKSLNK